MPKIKDIKPNISKISEYIKNIDNVQGVFLWGSVAKNFDNPNFIVKDIDIVIKTNIFSEDLLSIIDNKENNISKMSSENLEEEGYNPEAIEFTKKLLSFKNYNLDYWVITEDKKLLHWGNTTEDAEEWEEIKKEAEEYAKLVTGVSKKQLSCYNNKKEKWSLIYDYHINKYFSNIPKSWYLSSINPNNIFKNTRKI